MQLSSVLEDKRVLGEYEGHREKTSGERRFISVIGANEMNYLTSFVDINSSDVKILNAVSRSFVDSIENSTAGHIVNVRKINDIKYLNKFFEAVNKKLLPGGIFIGALETYEERRRKFFRNPAYIAYPAYGLDFVIKRVLPKLSITKKMYFAVTGGRNRVLSLAETLGRLISCGFEILDYKEIGGKTYFVGKKVRQPVYDKAPSYGLIFKMKRAGKDGKPIFVYKMRTMHPYAEYLQSYVYNLNKLQEGGKFKDDFRITAWGRVCRKLWIDELPMIINLLKGDLKLVGVRPLSLQYQSLYTEELRERRKKFKPGLIPPFYADMPKTLEEIMASESRYLDQYSRHPLQTDVKYFFMVAKNIIFKSVRSS